MNIFEEYVDVKTRRRTGSKDVKNTSEPQLFNTCNQSCFLRNYIESLGFEDCSIQYVHLNIHLR